MILSDKNRDAEMRAGRRERKNRSYSHMCVWHSRESTELRLGCATGRHDEGWKEGAAPAGSQVCTEH